MGEGGEEDISTGDGEGGGPASGLLGKAYRAPAAGVALH